MRADMRGRAERRGAWSAGAGISLDDPVVTAAAPAEYVYQLGGDNANATISGAVTAIVEGLSEKGGDAYATKANENAETIKYDPARKAFQATRMY